MVAATWPQESRYYVPGHINSKHIQRLLHEQTTYDCDGSYQNSPSGRIQTLVCTSDGITEKRVLNSLTEDESFVKSQSWSIAVRRKRRATVVVTVEQWRMYLEYETTCFIRLHKDRWMGLLEGHSVFAPALHIMYDNNGGQGEHVSDCKRTGKHACPDLFAPDKACAYHLYFKVGNFGNDERFAYLRHDFHTGNNFVLLAGTKCLQQVEEIKDRLELVEKPVNLFVLVLALLSCWHEQLEFDRWIQDYHVQNIEIRTGHNSLNNYMVNPLASEQLKLTREVALAAENVQGCIRAATNLEAIVRFAVSRCNAFHALLQSDPLSSSPSVQGPQSDGSANGATLRRSQAQLVSALEQVLSQVVAQKLQMQELAYRVRSQFDIMNSFISQSNSKANIDMAATSLADTTIMRDITLVTYLFLPGTFLATFFSMVFLNSDQTGDGITVSKWIWVYFVCAVPLTMGMGWKFGNTYLPRLRLMKRLRDRTRRHDGSTTRAPG